MPEYNFKRLSTMLLIGLGLLFQTACNTSILSSNTPGSQSGPTPPANVGNLTQSLSAPIILDIRTLAVSQHDTAVLEIDLIDTESNDSHLEFTVFPNSPSVSCPNLTGIQRIAQSAGAQGQITGLNLLTSYFMETVLQPQATCLYRVKVRAIQIDSDSGELLAYSDYTQAADLFVYSHKDVFVDPDPNIDLDAPTLLDSFSVDGNAQDDDAVLELPWKDNANGEDRTIFTISTVNPDATCLDQSAFQIVAAANYAGGSNSIVSQLFSQSFMQSVMQAQDGCQYEVTAQARLGLNKVSPISNAIVFTYTLASNNTVDLIAPTLQDLSVDMNSTTGIIDLDWLDLATGEDRTIFRIFTLNPSAVCPDASGSAILAVNQYSGSNGNTVSSNLFSLDFMQNILQAKDGCTYGIKAQAKLGGSEASDFSNILSFTFEVLNDTLPSLEAPTLMSDPVVDTTNSIGVLTLDWIDNADGEDRTFFQISTVNPSASCPAATGAQVLADAQYIPGNNGVITSVLFSVNFMDTIMSAQDNCQYQVCAKAKLGNDLSSSCSNSIIFTYDTPTDNSTVDLVAPVLLNDFTVDTANSNGVLNLNWQDLATGETDTAFEISTFNSSASCPSMVNTQVLSEASYASNSIDKNSQLFSLDFMQNTMQASAGCMYAVKAQSVDASNNLASTFSNTIVFEFTGVSEPITLNPPSINYWGQANVNPALGVDGVNIGFSWSYNGAPLTGNASFNLTISTVNPSVACPAVDDTQSSSMNLFGDSLTGAGYIHEFLLYLQNSANCQYEIVGNTAFNPSDGSGIVVSEDSNSVFFFYNSTTGVVSQ